MSSINRKRPPASTGGGSVPRASAAGPGPNILGQTLAQLRTEIAVIAQQQEEVLSLVRRQHKAHLTVDDLARETGRTAYTVRRWVAEGKVQAIRVAGGGPRGRLLIPYAEFRRLVDGVLPAYDITTCGEPTSTNHSAGGSHEHAR